MERPPPDTVVPKLSGIAVKFLGAYTRWHETTRHIPKMRRYSLGVRIDALFADVIELIASAQFSPSHQRADILARAITKNDVLKFMLFVLFELGGIEQERFSALAEQVEEVGRMLYGWRNRSVSNTRTTR